MTRPTDEEWAAIRESFREMRQLMVEGNILDIISCSEFRLRYFQMMRSLFDESPREPNPLDWELGTHAARCPHGCRELYEHPILNAILDRVDPRNPEEASAVLAVINDLEKLLAERDEG